MLNAGVPVTIMSQAELAKHSASYPACEAYGKQVNGTFGNQSPLCPPLVLDTFYAAIQSAKDSHSESQIAAATAKQLLALTGQFFFQLPLVEAALASKIAVVAIAVKQQEALDQAKNFSRVQMAARAESAAGNVEAAAAAALKGNAAEGERSVQRAKHYTDVAMAAYKVLLGAYSTQSASSAAGSCASDANCTRARVAVARAQAASALAVKNAAHAARMRILLGVGVAAGTAGAAYYFLRK